MDLKKIKIRKDQILILFLVGILLLIISLPAKKEEENEEQVVSAQIKETDNNQYVEYLERDLENILSQMEGAGDVSVMITLAASAEQVVEKDLEIQDETVTESDSQGGTRTTNQSSHGETTIYKNQESDGEVPYVSKEISPKVEGVVVIAEGGDNAVVVKNITESVQALFGIETHKIRIVKKGG